jgi:hypothetical protein
MKNEAVADAPGSPIPELTKTQAKRLAARLNGNSLSQIAETEGCTKQAVAKSLATPTVKRAVFTLLGRPLASQNLETGESVDLVCEALQVVADTMLNAARPVVLTATAGGYTQQRVERFPDYGTRLAAASRLLSFVDKPPVALEHELETVTTHVRERRRVDAG